MPLAHRRQCRRWASVLWLADSGARRAGRVAVLLRRTCGTRFHADADRDFDEWVVVAHPVWCVVVRAAGLLPRLTAPKIGIFHKVSRNYMPLWVAEFQFRFNNRENADIFGTAIKGC
jgi:hypothetical protein